MKTPKLPNLSANAKYLTTAFVILIAFVLTAFGNISTHTFLHWDDITIVLENDVLRPLTITNIINILTDFRSSNWHPVTWFSYAFDLVLYGESAIYFKITSIVIHILNCILVFYLAFVLQYAAKFPTHKNIAAVVDKRYRDISIASFIAALIFSIHPQHVEPVSWISGRKELLCAFFYMLAVICYIQAHYNDNRRYWKNLITIFFLFALMSKSMAVTLPAILVLLDIYPLNKIQFNGSIISNTKALLQNKVLYIIIAAAVSAITLITQNSNITDIQSHSFLHRMLSSSYNAFYYLYSIADPSTITPFHPMGNSDYNHFLLLIIPAMLLVAFCIGFYTKNYKAPLIILGAFLALLLPVIGLVHLGHTARADRYAYIPTIIFYILIGIYIVKAGKIINTNIWKTALFSSTVIFLVCSLTTLTHIYNNAWATDKSLWKNVIERYPHSSATAYMNYGNGLFEDNQFQLAIENYEKALQVNPHELTAFRNMAFVYEKMNESKKTIATFERMLSENPDSHYAHSTIGDYYFRNKNFNIAKFHYDTALNIEPTDDIALFRSSFIDFLNSDLQKAETKLNIILELNPSHVDALKLKTQIKVTTNDIKSAYELAKKLIALEPDDKYGKHILSQIGKPTSN